jgi:hypothetical protein
LYEKAGVKDYKMKNPDRTTVARLEELPNIGKALADDLRLVGIDHPRQLIGQNPFHLYDQLCQRTGQRQDPCVIDAFMAVVDFMDGGEPRPWWSFTAARKSHYVGKEKPRSRGHGLVE